MHSGEGAAACRLGDPGSKIYICSNTDTDYFRLLTACLQQRGLCLESVTQLTETEYRTGSRRRGLAKLRLRLNMYVGYPARLICKAVFASSRVTFLVTSNTFYAPLVVAFVGLFKRFKTVHLVYDLYPDAIEVSGKLAEHSLSSRLLGKVVAWSFRLCKGTVYLGDFLRAHAERRWGRCLTACTIDVGANPALFEPPRELPASGPVWLHYGGQLGLMHDAGALIACAKAALGRDVSDVKFSFLLSGAHAQTLKTELSGFHVEIGDAVPSEEWRRRIRSFHIGLVTLSPGGATVCLPSKTYALFAGGLAVIAVCPRWSDLARLILEYEAGWVVNNSPFSDVSELLTPDYMGRTRARRPEAEIAQEFVELLRRVTSDRRELERKRQNARRAADTIYTDIAGRWERYLRQVENLATR